jgi:hypothetical protein
MKTTPNTLKPATPDFAGINFPGLVVDPESGRLCASIRDLTKGLNLHHEQIRRAAGRKYQDGRFLDFGDVVRNRAKTPGRGRPRKHPLGIVLSELTATLATALAGVALSATLIAAIGEGTAPVLHEMVGAREQQVRTMEELGFSSAADVRKQWEGQKLIAVSRISDLETLNTEGAR